MKHILSPPRVIQLARRQNNATEEFLTYPLISDKPYNGEFGSARFEPETGIGVPNLDPSLSHTQTGFC